MRRFLTISLLNINEAQLTINVLEKLAHLSAHTWSVQLIVVDNGSYPDQVQQLLEWFSATKHQFEEVIFLASSSNLGSTGGRNAALKLASGDNVLILDNDVILPDDPHWLETLWNWLEEYPEVGLVGPMLVFANHPNIVQVAGIGLTDRGRVGYLNRAQHIDTLPPTPAQVVASPAACWLLRRKAQQEVGLFSEEFYPVQYEDVDLCVRLGLVGWKIICDRSIRIQHIENVTTRNLKDHPFARMTVKHGMQFREKWADFLPKIATIVDKDIYWGPIPNDQA